MILLDANLLVYAHGAGLPFHTEARSWLDEQLNAGHRVALPWPSLLSFMRLVSNPRIFERPTTVAAAWQQVEAWLGCVSVWIPAPTERHRSVLGQLVQGTRLAAKDIPDAHLAALAIEHGLTLCSTDGDFARYDGLRWKNPLARSRS